MPEVCLLGTGGMKPLPHRALTGLWVSHEGRSLMVDCGEGMQISAARSGCSLARLEAMFITHFHADHIAGLPGFLLSAGNYGKTSDLHIYAPKGAEYFIGGLMRICPELPFCVILHELDENGGELEALGLLVKYMPVKHRVPCCCYSFTENRLPVFDPVKATELDIPVKHWKTLHAGGTVELQGRTITSDMVTGEKRPPIKITYITDTLYFEGLAEFAEGSDLLIAEGMYGDDSYIDKMKEKCHMVFSESARLANCSHSKELWLTHYSPALKDPFEYEEMMKGLFENTVISSDGISKKL